MLEINALRNSSHKNVGCPEGSFLGVWASRWHPDALLAKTMPLTPQRLSPLPGFEARPGQVRKLPVNCGWAVVFAGFSSFLHLLQLASHDLAAIWQRK